MKVIKKVCVTATVLSLIGCVSTPPAKNYRDINSAISDFSIPELGTIAEASVGDTLLTQGTKRIGEAIKLVNSGYRPQSGISNVYIKFAESDLYYWYADSKSPKFTTEDGLATNGVTIKKEKSTGNLCPFQITGGGYSAGYNCYKGVKHEEINEYALNHINSFQQSLMYNGKIGSKINIAYREFSNDSARPAFNNSVEYDMSESTTIAYKGAVLKVIEYTNTKIRYEVVKNFNTSK